MAHAAVKRICILVLAFSIAISVVAASGPGNTSLITGHNPDFNITNHTFTDGEIPYEPVVTPTPIEIFRIQWESETLPGPRYMGFGPSVIGLSIDPRILAIGFAIVLIALVIWFICFRKYDNDEGDEGGEE